jgi:hypothetical protein
VIERTVLSNPQRPRHGRSEAELTEKRGQHREERALVMELLRRYGGVKQRSIDVRFGLDEGLVSRACRAIREKTATEPKIRNGFHDLDTELIT